MNQDLSVLVRLSAQRALLGHIPALLRAVSVDVDADKVYLRCVFDGESSEADRELLSMAASELIADFFEPYTIKEEYLHVSQPKRMSHLKHLVFLRHELES